MRKWPRALVAISVLVVATVAVTVTLRLMPSGAPPVEVDYGELRATAGDGTAQSVKISGERVEVRRADGRVFAVVGDEPLRADLAQRFADAKVPVAYEPTEPAPSGLASALAAFGLLALVVTAGFFFHRRRQMAHRVIHAGGGRAGGVRFSDVAGMDEVKQALQETVDFLQDPRRFTRLGARAPRGVLLTGAPGTGKTLLARAVASEAGVPFLSCSGSSFQEMYVGVGAARVRRLFKEARRLSPCIVFIDEIDCVGKTRTSGGDGAASEHDQTINQLLVEMDGFDGSTGVVVIASTNRPDVLDAAVVRPGRFDRQVKVPLPDLRGREQILAVHARPIDLHEEVDLSHIARQTPGFSGAELANLLNEAAILAARDNAMSVHAGHIESARDLVMMGAERKGLLVDPRERYATAVHEAGHVAVGMAAPHADPVHKVSILPRGGALGLTASLPERDRLMYEKAYLEDQICFLLGGRAAEVAILGTMTAGASDDIERATRIARKMVTELGMSEIGPICLKVDPAQPHSEKLLDMVEETTLAILRAQLQRATLIVESSRAQIAKLVEHLLERDTLDEHEIRDCFRGAQPAIARVGSMPSA